MTIEYKDGKYDQSNRIHNGQKPSPTLTRTSTGNDLFALGGQHPNTAVVNKPHTFKIRGGCEGGGKGYLGQDEKAYTISTTQDQHLYQHFRVRRLTPVECERLQGFPDNYTNIKPNCPDGS